MCGLALVALSQLARCPVPVGSQFVTYQRLELLTKADSGGKVFSCAGFPVNRQSVLSESVGYGSSAAAWDLYPCRVQSVKLVTC